MLLNKEQQEAFSAFVKATIPMTNLEIANALEGIECRLDMIISLLMEKKLKTNDPKIATAVAKPKRKYTWKKKNDQSL